MDPLHRFAFPLLLVSLSATPLSAQEVSVRGVVRDAATSSPLAYAVVEIVGAGRRFSADGAGRYEIRQLSRGVWTLRAHAVGHVEADLTLSVTAGSPRAIEQDFLLEARAIEIEGILVECMRAPRPVPDEPVGAPPARIEQARMAATPTVFEPDVLRVVQTLPSVATASDFSSALYVRGGTPDQTIVLLDGTPLFNPYHLGGLFSAIDAGLVEDVVAHVGPMSATLGDRLAGVIEINSRAPPLATTRGWGNVGLVSANAGISSPLGAGGYTVSFRHTYVDLATRAAHNLGLMKFAFPYGFTDGYAHLRQALGPGELRVSGYLNSEYVSPPGEELPGQEIDFDWGTGAASTSWEGYVAPHLSMRTSLGYSQFVGDFFAGHTGSGPPTFKGRLLNRLVRPAVDFLWLAGRYDVRFGTAAELYGFGYRMQTRWQEFRALFPEYDDESTLTTLAAHLETEWQADDPRTRWRVGVRSLAAEDAGVALMPRIGWSHQLHDEVSLFASIGRKAQAVRSMRSEEAVFSAIFAYDMLAPTHGRIAVGDEIAGGIDWTPLPTTSLRVEAYGRRARDVAVAPVPGNIYFTPALVPDETDSAQDLAAGIEVSANHRDGSREFWLAYSGSWLQRTVGDETFRPRFHRVHHLQILGSQSISGRTLLSASMQLGSGQSYSRPIALHEPYRFDPTGGGWYGGGLEIVLEERNTSRLPFYFRLDVGVRSSFTPRMFGRDVTISPYLSVLNALSYRNSMFAIYDLPWDAPDGSIKETHAPQMPLLPTLGMEWRF